MVHKLTAAFDDKMFNFQSPTQTFEDIGLDDSDLRTIKTKDLNNLLKKKKIDKNRQKEIKQRRRTIKNRYVGPV
jgi:hypothetical protein